MRMVPLFFSTVIIIFMFLFQWPKININQKKEKAAFITLTILGWLLINFLFIFPNTPGPTEFIDFMYKPLGRLLE
jgi:multisubunit Na+/H+ antiporter MnhB subunit